jgi:hypothetical protein
MHGWERGPRSWHQAFPFLSFEVEAGGGTGGRDGTARRDVRRTEIMDSITVRTEALTVIVVVIRRD